MLGKCVSYEKARGGLGFVVKVVVSADAVVVVVVVVVAKFNKFNK